MRSESKTGSARTLANFGDLTPASSRGLIKQMAGFQQIFTVNTRLAPLSLRTPFPFKSSLLPLPVANTLDMFASGLAYTKQNVNHSLQL